MKKHTALTFLGKTRKIEKVSLEKKENIGDKTSIIPFFFGLKGIGCKTISVKLRKEYGQSSRLRPQSETLLNCSRTASGSYRRNLHLL